MIELANITKEQNDAVDWIYIRLRLDWLDITIKQHYAVIRKLEEEREELQAQARQIA